MKSFEPNKIFTFIFICSIVLFFSMCKKDTDSQAEISVYLQDAPAGYDKVKIELKGVSIYNQTSGQWLNLSVSNGVFDLLTLDSLHPAFLGKIKTSPATISQLQIDIGNQDSVTVNGISHPLILDPIDLDKLKVKMNHIVNAGNFYKLTIDFKAAESIDSSGNVYKLKASLEITLKSV